MSYILDALRRADAERHRGQAPALQQVTGQTPPPSSRGRSPPLHRLAPWLLAAGLGAAALTIWLISRPPAPVPPLPPNPTEPSAQLSAQPPSTAGVSTPAPARAQAAALPPPRPAPTAAASAPGAAPVTMPAEPDSARMPVPATTARALPPDPAPAIASGPSAAAAPASTSGSAPAPRAIHASELAAPQRAAINRLGIGGAVHSPERGQSFVLVGGQLMREGATLAPGITLERISPHLLLLRLGEQRVEWPL